MLFHCCYRDDVINTIRTRYALHQLISFLGVTVSTCALFLFEMGAIWSLIRRGDIRENECEMAKVPATADDYNATVTELFSDDQWHWGRLQVWFWFSEGVRDHLPLNEHEKLNEYVWKWFIFLGQNRPEHNVTLACMKRKWVQGSWQMYRIHEQTDL